MRDTWNTQRILVMKPLGKQPLGSTRKQWMIPLKWIQGSKLSRWEAGSHRPNGRLWYYCDGAQGSNTRVL